MNLFKKPIPTEKKYLWKTGPENLDDYKIKSSYVAKRLANHAHYLSMINDGIYSYSGRGGSISTAHTNEDIEKIEYATHRSLKTLKENNLIGKL
jgi:glutamate-1-semialdehyde aminotransferase